MPADAMAGSAEGGAVTAGEDDAYLEIVSAGSGASTVGTKDPTQMTPQELRAELALSRERVETERVEKEALQQRINALEQNVGKMKGMLSIEDDALSDVQALGASVEGEPSEGEMLEADIVAEAETEMAESIAETDDLLAEQSLEDAITEEATGEQVEGGAAEDEAAVFLDETSTETEVSEEVVVENAVVEDVAQPAPIVATPPAEPDPLSKLLSDPILLAAAGGGLLLILAVIGLIIKRRKAAAEQESESFVMGSDDDLESLADEIATDTAEEANIESLAGDADQIDEALDDDATMILDDAEDTLIVEQDATAETEEEEPRDDVIAEADVYLAYGIYQQAEELLTQAIADNPERDDYRVKLAETHYACKNAEAFVEVATDIKKRQVMKLPRHGKKSWSWDRICVPTIYYSRAVWSVVWTLTRLRQKRRKWILTWGLMTAAERRLILISAWMMHHLNYPRWMKAILPRKNLKTMMKRWLRLPVNLSLI